MKTPSVRELRKLDDKMEGNSGKLYRRVLRAVVRGWTDVSGSRDLEDAITSWNIPRMLQFADDMVKQRYLTTAEHFAGHQMAALIRKYPFTSQESGLDPELAAKEKFLAAEHRCKRTNQRFRAWNRRTEKNRPFARVFGNAQRWVAWVLGSQPNLPRVYAKCDLTGGANVGIHGNATNLARKLLAERWSVTPTALPYLKAALDANFHYASRVAWQNEDGVQCLEVDWNLLRHSCELVNYNKVGFVLKDAFSHRGMASEPTGNNLVQKGTDTDMRDLLKRVGLDLRYQEPNQRMAYKGSFDEEDGYVTIDLKSASDCMATEFVRHMLILVPDWFCFLNRIRSPSYMLDGKITSYEKFVSMGNGFCFPLQTLLFAALIKGLNPDAVAGSDFRVYGDDIIVRKSIAHDLLGLLHFSGFLPNSRKTLLEGPYRESCGSNWYRGEDVTPATLDYKLDSLQSCFKFLNLARRNTRSTEFLHDAIGAVIASIPDDFLFYRPFKGRPETGIDPAGLEFLPKWDRHSAWHCPVWLELHSRPVADDLEGLPPLPGWVVAAGALRGSSPGKRQFTLRRSVSIRIVRVAAGCPELPDTGSGWETFPSNERLQRGEPAFAKLPGFSARLPDLRDYRLLR